MKSKKSEYHSLEEIFNFHYGEKLKSDIEKIDNLCKKFNLNPEDFWQYYRTHIGDCSGADFIQDMLEFFYFHLETTINKITKPEGLNIFGWFYFQNENIVLSEDGENEFENLIKLPYKTKKKFMENELFKYFIDAVIDTVEYDDIFSASEKRRMKLEKLK